MSSTGAPNLRRVYKISKRLPAREIMFLTWIYHPRLFYISRPRSFMWSTTWRASPPSETCGSWTGLFKKLTCMTWHFDGLGSISLTLHQSSKASRWYWSLWEFVLALHTSAKVRSSTNFHRSGVVSAASLTITEKMAGPNFVPCGTPQVMFFLTWKLTFVLNALSTIWQETADRWNYRRPHSGRDNFANSNSMVDAVEGFCKINRHQGSIVERLFNTWDNFI